MCHRDNNYQKEKNMLGFKYIKADPSTYLIHYNNGKIRKEGLGLSFFYFAPSSSLVSVAIGSEEIQFIFNETTQDFQQVTVQGQLTYKVIDVNALTKMLNYTLNEKGVYSSEDPQKLPKRLVNLIQVAIRKELTNLNLKQVMPASEVIAYTIKKELEKSSILTALGLEIMEISIVAIKPNQETARALEAETRESLLRQADEALYIRRNAAIEQERIIKENELKTEVAVEQKKREIMERKLESERIEQEKRREMNQEAMAGEIIIQKQKEELVTLSVENIKKEADAKGYAIKANLDAFRDIDPKMMRALSMNRMNPAQLIASSFIEFAENADKIGQLNINPDMIEQLVQANHV